MDRPINVLGSKLIICGTDPVTGYYRDGVCNTCKEDFGSHTVCVEVTKEFLDYSKSQGNDLSTPMPAYGFPGVKSGDSWCLCASRWLEAEKSGMAPKVHLQSTHLRALEIIPLELLKKYEADIGSYG